MSKRGVRIARHSSILMGMEIGTRIFDAVVFVVLARYLAPEGFGLLAFALSFASLFSLLPGLGMGSQSIRDVARNPEQLSPYLSNGLVAKAILAMLTLTVISLASGLSHFPAEKSLVVLLAGLFMILDTNLRYVLSFFQAAQRMTTVAAVSLAVHCAWLLVSLAVVWFKGGIVELLHVRNAITVIGLVASVGLIHVRLQRIRWSFNPTFTWQMLKASIPFAIFRVKNTLYTDIDTVMLSVMRSEVMTGWYAAANKLLRVFRFVPSGFYGALLPEMSRQSRTSLADVSRILTRSCKYLIIIGLPIAGGLCVTADHVVSLLFGEAYQGSVMALRIISWSLLFEFLNSATVAALAAVNRERRGSLYLLGGVAFSGLSNLIVVPLFGHLGAAATTVMTEAFVFVLQVRLLYRVLPNLDLWGEVVKPVVGVAAMMAVAWLIRPAGLVWTIIGAAVVYVGCLIITRTVGSREWSLLTGMLRMEAADERA